METSCIFRAISKKHFELVELILEKMVRKIKLNEVLWVACKVGFTRILEMIEKRNPALLNSQTINWNHALFGASVGKTSGYKNIEIILNDNMNSEKQLETVKWTIENGADDFNGALGVGCFQFNPKLVQLMIQYGATHFHNGLQVISTRASRIFTYLLEEFENEDALSIWCDLINMCSKIIKLILETDKMDDYLRQMINQLDSDLSKWTLQIANRE